MIRKEIGYSYNDLTIVPSRISYIDSRSECNPFVYGNKLPIFTAPMSSVVGLDNYLKWESNGIIPILPRTIPLDWEGLLDLVYKGYWVALGLDEFKKLEDELKLELITDKARVLLDIANGHMNSIYFLSKKLKNKFGDKIEIMIGNIANPETYLDCIDAGIDYVRCSIGSGAGCLTTSNTGIHYPIASLLDEINKLKGRSINPPKVIADGGIRNYSDVIKALALGADYVMIGGLFSQFLESSGEIICTDSNKIVHQRDSIYKFLFDNAKCSDIIDRDSSDGDENIGVKKYDFAVEVDLEICKEHIKRNLINHFEIEKLFYGMSTKRAQMMIGVSGVLGKLKTSEGIEKKVVVKYTMNQWVENMIDYLKSAMSYCGCIDLQSFIGKQTLIPNSPGEIGAVNK